MKSRYGTVEVICHPYDDDDSEYLFLRNAPNVFELHPGVRLATYAEVGSA
jgi:hypothetical protein